MNNTDFKKPLFNHISFEGLSNSAHKASSFQKLLDIDLKQLESEVSSNISKINTIKSIAVDIVKLMFNLKNEYSNPEINWNNILEFNNKINETSSNNKITKLQYLLSSNNSLELTINNINNKEYHFNLYNNDYKILSIEHEDYVRKINFEPNNMHYVLSKINYTDFKKETFNCIETLFKKGYRYYKDIPSSIMQDIFYQFKEYIQELDTYQDDDYENNQMDEIDCIMRNNIMDDVEKSIKKYEFEGLFSDETKRGRHG